MKVAIYGSAANDADDLAIKSAREIGQLLAEHGHTIITGASFGAPFEAASAAFKAGGRVVGYSPAVNIKEHQTRFGDSVKGFTELIFIPSDYKYVANNMACYKYRNISTVMNCDKVIIIGGRYGTLDEFIQAYEFGKEIGIIKNSKGAAEVIATDMMSLILEKVYKDTGAKVYFEDDPKKLLKDMSLI
ncbi:MAG: hypothetical protein NTY81_02305 [Candidatus Staskawiczbacteria bacterium]|nr:hypothetical protein [Candidatus Staskawiczbacteria bacterium]